MNEEEARDNVRPFGNVTPMPRLAEPDGEKPYPEGPLASRRVLTHDDPHRGVHWEDGKLVLEPDEREEELTGVRIWMTRPGNPAVARELVRGLEDAARALGFDVVDIQVGEFEGGQR